MVRLEGNDELLVIQAKGIGCVERNRGVGNANANMLVHHAFAFLQGQRVPGAGRGCHGRFYRRRRSVSSSKEMPGSRASMDPAYCDESGCLCLANHLCHMWPATA